MDQSSAEQIKENFRRVTDELQAAAIAARRDPQEVQLVGVTKYVDAEHASVLLAAGCHNLGESRPQELWAKAADDNLQSTSVRWHLIGHLQRNKVNKTLPICHTVHAVDSERLLRAIDNSASDSEISARIMLEVNCSGDSAKHGLTADETRGLVERLDEFPHVGVEGFMTMAAREGGSAVAQQNFASLRQLRDRLATHEIPLTELSMGMSGDFRQAIAEGSTIVRIGSALWEGVE